MTIINVNEATLRTLSVEVRSLVVSGKQVTLAVFRQLEKESLVNIRTGRFVGTPWGRVNYYFDECKDADPKEHIHAVWQKGEELRRDCFTSNYPQFRLKHLHRTFSTDAHPYGDSGDLYEWFITGRLSTKSDIFDHFIKSLKSNERYIQGYLDSWSRFLQLGITPPITNDDAKRILVAITSDLSTFEKNYQESWKTVSNLIQLFIAV